MVREMEKCWVCSINVELNRIPIEHLPQRHTKGKRNKILRSYHGPTLDIYEAREKT